MSALRQIERCGRRAAELITAGDIILVADPQADVLQVVYSALSTDIQADLEIVTPDTMRQAATLCLIVARMAAVDGSIVCTTSCATCASSAAQLAIPIYALLAGGPDSEALNAAALRPAADEALVAADQINAIVTDRGIYRPAMLVRHLHDGDTPLDVIVLLQ